MNFTPTQISTDFSRPGAGANQWNNQNIISITGKRLDAYYRFTWLQFQPAGGSDGVFDFTAFDTQIQAAIKAGQKFSFGIMQQCGGCDANAQSTIGGAVLIYPTWLHNKMQAEAVKDYATGGEWFPNYNSASWLKAWNDLNVAVNNHIMTTSYSGVRYQDVIGEIDVRGYGDYGEWTNNDFSGPTGTRATDASLIAIIDSVVSNFPTFQCVYMMATVDGNQLNNTMNSPAVGYHALTVTNQKGKLGWRRDSWGQTDSYLSQWTDTNPTVYNGLVFKTEIMSRFRFAPIVGEPQDQGSAGNFTSLPSQMSKYGVSSFGNGNFNGATNATIAANFQAASKAAGYRLSIISGSVNGSSITISWQNSGVAPIYESWNVIFQLRAGSTVVWSGNSVFNPTLFLPGTISITDTFDWSALSGSLDLYVIIKDPAGYRSPLPLAISSQNTDGSYLLQSSIPVSGSGSTTPPPSGGTTPPPQIKIVSNIFGSVNPTVTAANDGTPLELGVKFTSSVNGYINGIRFYKTSANTGTHTGELYSAAGVRLASTTFTGETASGWQTVTFQTPVPIVSGVTYVAAYFSSGGGYSVTNSGLQLSTINGNLSTIADGKNGVYVYTSAPAFPSSSYLSSNYWVDVVFSSGVTVPQAPTSVISGPTDVTLSGAIITLDGSASSAGNYSWAGTGGLITSPTSAKTTVTGLQPGTYTFTLSVTANGLTNKSTITTTIHF